MVKTDEMCKRDLLPGKGAGVGDGWLLPPSRLPSLQPPPLCPSLDCDLTSLSCLGRAVSSPRPWPGASELDHQINKRNPSDVLKRIPPIFNVAVYKASSNPSFLLNLT